MNTLTRIKKAITRWNGIKYERYTFAQIIDRLQSITYIIRCEDTQLGKSSDYYEITIDKDNNLYISRY